jgi:16S rRNA (uracil1498-N3)-methyltransferase
MIFRMKMNHHFKFKNYDFRFVPHLAGLFMTLPFFYIADYNALRMQMELDEDTSRHVVQVLRMKPGEKLNLTDGKGTLLTCEVTDAHKRHCLVSVVETSNKPPATKKTAIAISLLKNANRFEWFLEKATEIGVTEIIPLICNRTEKEKFRFDRMQQICISAMLQSQQCWLPVLCEPVQFVDLARRQLENSIKFIAHCDEGAKGKLNHQLIAKSSNHLITIGPEGDFTNAEIEQALKSNFIPVSLGETRLRTETAGVVAATLLCIA